MDVQIVVGYSNWRDRKEPYDHSGITDPTVRGMLSYFLTHPPGEWSRDAASRIAFDQIWPGALGKLDQSGLVPEHPDVMWVINAASPEAISRAIAEGRLFGHEPILELAPDHTGEIQIQTSFGPSWVRADSVLWGQISVSTALSLIRVVVAEELAKAG